MRREQTAPGAGGSCTFPADHVFLSGWQSPFPALSKSRHTAERVRGKEERQIYLLSEGKSHGVAWERPLDSPQGRAPTSAELRRWRPWREAPLLAWCCSVLTRDLGMAEHAPGKPEDIAKLGDRLGGRKVAGHRSGSEKEQRGALGGVPCAGGHSLSRVLAVASSGAPRAPGEEPAC